MKTIIISTFITIFSFALNVVVAQQFDKETFLKTSSEERAAKLTELMKSQLTLSGTQVKEVLPINLTFAKAMERIIKSGDSRFSKAKQAKNELERTEGSLKKVLTAVQFARFEKIVDDLITQAKSGNIKKDLITINSSNNEHP